MSKLTKFFKHPVMFFEDAAKNKKNLKEGKPKIFVVGFSTWKTYLRMYFSDYDLIFLPKDIKKSQFNAQYRKDILSLKKSCQVFIWGFKAPEYILEFLKNEKISTKFVEDGFVRSIALGATKTPPMSLCLDSQAPYFDARHQTDIEDLLNNYFLTEDQVFLAKKKLQEFVGSGVSKYNDSPDIDSVRLYGRKTKKRVLVIGQVEDDASIQYGCEKKIDNNELVRLAYKENPDAEIIYKPHPDVLSGHRKHLSNPEDVSNICKIVRDHVSLPSSFSTIDHVYTITSLAGLEAAFRGIKVTTVGAPFYSCWGITDSRQVVERRKRKLELYELFYISYYVYPKYFDTKNGEEKSLEYVIDEVRKKDKITVDKKKEEQGTTVFFNCNLDVSGYSKNILRNIFSTAIKNCVIKTGDFRTCVNEIVIKDKNEVYSFLLNVTALPGAGALSFPKGVVPFEYQGGLSNGSVLEHFLNVSFYKYNNDFLSLYHHYENSDKKTLRSTAVYGLKAGVYSEYVVSCAVDYLFTNFHKVSVQDKQLLLKKLYRIFGTKGPMESVLNLYFTNRGKLTTEILVTCVGVLCEAGEYSKALKLAADIHEHNPSLWKEKRILAVSWLLYSSGYIVEQWAQVDAQNFDLLQSNIAGFERYVLDKNIAVVGNSPCELKSLKGGEIDSSEKVMRFNSAVTSYPHYLDYGRKTDILVINPRYYESERNYKNDLDYIILSDANPFLTPGLSFKVDELKKFSKYVCLIPGKIDTFLVNKVEGSPSSGLKMMYWLYLLKGKLDQRNVYGFSMLDQAYGMATSYSTNKPKYLGTIHNWDKEHSFFCKLLTNK